jgi:hypothetical protein
MQFLNIILTVLPDNLFFIALSLQDLQQFFNYMELDCLLTFMSLIPFLPTCKT